MSVRVVSNGAAYDFKDGFTWELSKDDWCLHVSDVRHTTIAAFAVWEAVHKT